MANQLTLDVTDPEVAEMVAQWTDGGKYTVELAITQVSNDGTTFTATVDEVVDYGDMEAPEATVPAAPMPAPAPINE